jgi:hypothetical protein
MLKTLDILIGVATVMLLFSMAVTIITQFLTTVMQSRGKSLLEGLAGLLKQIDPTMEATIAQRIATVVLTHPLVASAGGKLGEVVLREEFTLLLMGLAAGESSAKLGNDAQAALMKLLRENGIADPATTLKNVRAAALQLEASNPELANDIRHSMAVLQEAKSEFVAKVHGWYDQTIDRVGARFTVTARMVTFFAALVVAITVQLDTFALVDRLSVDDQFRAAVQQGASEVLNAVPTPTPNPTPTPSSTPATDAASNPSNPSPAATPAGSGARTPTPVTTPSPSPSATAPAGSNTPTPTPSTATGATGTQTAAMDAATARKYYDFLSKAGLVTLPGPNWGDQFTAGKIPGILLSTLLLSLGAPFWYSRLQDLLRMRSALAQKDDQQRTIRQTTQSSDPADGTAAKTPAPATVSMLGEQGDINAVG